MHAAIADKRAELATLCRRFGVRRLEVFGSAARGFDFDADLSDVDFLVEFDEAANSSACVRPSRTFWSDRSIWSSLPRSKIPVCAGVSNSLVDLSMQRDPRAYLWDP